MPTITSTPVQVGDGHWTQFFNQENPFYIEAGSNLYQVLFNGTGISPSPTTTNRLGIFKRAVASVGGTWTEQDAANTPDPGMQSGYGVVSIKGTVISICYLEVFQFALKIVTYDTATDTWGSPGPAFNLTDALSRFAFVQRSDDTYVVIAASPFRLYYLTYASGAWSTQTNVRLTGGTVLGGVIDSSDRIHFLATGSNAAIADYMQLSATYVLGSILYSVGTLEMREGQFASIALWGSDTVVIGWRPTSGTGAFSVRVAMGTPLSAPVITETQVYAQDPAAGFSERAGWIQTAVGTGGDLNVFFIDTNFLLPMNQIKQGVWDGSAWSVSVFYDAITNPAVNAIAGNLSTQKLRTIQGLQLSGGWSVATTMTINDVANPPATTSSAEFLEANSPVPPPPGPGTITCQIIITGPPPPPHGQGTPKTLRYQIPQRRWFPHTYND